MQTQKQHLVIMMQDLNALRQEVALSPNGVNSILKEIDERGCELLYQYLATP
jgi:hypothetical protein|tara:strand:+ start:787 stop:942 length:156 start_codon:yes stop_codon:yes gene_type:complete